MYRIVMVDDEEKIRAIVRKYAEFEGNEVVEAADGMEAVKLAKSQDFDIIILDIMMPELDGFSACKEIRKYKDTPAVSYTHLDVYKRQDHWRSGRLRPFCAFS